METINPKDFFIELYLRVKFLPRFFKECHSVKVRDLYIIFDNAIATRQASDSI